MRKISTTLLALILVLHVTGQIKKDENTFTEKIFIHTDREIYMPGEIIWFKLYCIDQTKKRFSGKSQLAYIELIGPSGHVVKRKKILLKDGVGRGSLNIPENLASGTYSVFHYTHGMKTEFKQQEIYTNLIIYNPNNQNFKDSSKIDGKFDLALQNKFLYSGLKNSIVLDQSCCGKDSLKVNLLDNNDSTLKDTSFSGIYPEISFIPEKEKNYRLEIFYQGETIQKKLPEVKTGETVFTLETEDESYIKIRRTSLSKANNKNYEICNLKTGQVLGRYDNGQNIVRIFKEKLLFGLNYLAVKDENGSIVWERPVIVDKTTSEFLQVKGIKNHYSNREKVDMVLDFTGASDALDNGNVSVSITKTNKPGEKVSFYNNTGILSSGEMSFSQLNEQVLFWNRDESGEMLSSSAGFEDRGILIGGFASDNAGNPLKKKQIVLSFPGSVSRVKVTKTDEQGNFNFNVFPDKHKKDIVISALDARKKVVFQLNNKYLNNYNNSENVDLNQYLTELKPHLKELYFNSKIVKRYRQTISAPGLQNENSKPLWLNYSFYGAPDETVSFDDFVPLDSITEYFYEVISSVNLVGRNDKFRVISEDNRLLNGAPAFFLDGVFFKTSNYIKQIKPQLCNSIEIVRKPFLMKEKTFQGLVALYTKKGNFPVENMPEYSTRIEYPLYDTSGNFLSWNKQIPDHIPYFRNTLYWNPDIDISSDKKAHIEFLTPDDNSWYEMEIFGFTREGEPVLKREYFYVGEEFTNKRE